MNVPKDPWQPGPPPSPGHPGEAAWAQPGPDSPPADGGTEQLPRYTSDPYAAYGQDAGQTPQWQHTAPLNPTAQFLTYDPSAYASQPYAAQQPPPPPPKKSGIWAIAAAGVVLALVILVGAVLLLRQNSDESSTASEPTATPTLAAPPSGSQAPTRTPLIPTPSQSIQLPPGLGDVIEGFGAAIGTITANDGSTITIEDSAKRSVTIKTDAKTQVISMRATKVSELQVGESIVVQGSKNADGSFQANVILSTGLPG